jgi:hypothetical protein
MRFALVAEEGGGVSLGQPSKDFRSQLSTRMKAGAALVASQKGSAARRIGKVGGGNDQSVGRCFRSDIEPECADGAHSKAAEGGNERVREVAFSELELRAAEEAVTAELVVVAGWSGGRLCGEFAGDADG